MNKLFFPVVREFNNISYFNSILYDLKKTGSKVAVLSPKKHVSMYTYADEIFVTNNGIYDIFKSDNIEQNVEFFLNTYLSEIDKVKLLTKDYEHISAPKQFDYFGYHIGDKWYYSIFSNTARMLVEEKENFKWTVPTKDRYDFYKNKRPYVVVNGRWLFKKNNTELYNNKYEELIEFFIKKKIKVINTTFNKPNLNYDPNYYEEPNCVDYLEQAAIFSNANMVYSIYSAGGINQHLLCKANFLAIGYTDGSWVDNGAEFGYNGISVLQARNKISGIFTNKILLNQLHAYDRMYELALSEPPELTNFFDTNKVKYL